MTHLTCPVGTRTWATTLTLQVFSHFVVQDTCNVDVTFVLSSDLLDEILVAVVRFAFYLAT